MKENEYLKSEVYDHFQLIEKVITAFGADPEKARGEKPLQWILKQKGIPIWIYLTYLKPYKEYFIQIASPIIKMPTEHKDVFCQRLIALNATLVGAAFMEKKGAIYITSSREVVDLSFEEAHNIVSRIINYTNFYHQVQKKGLLDWPYYGPQNRTKPGPSSLS